MTNEKATKDMQELIRQHDFRYEGELTYDGHQIFTRRWKQTIRVAWYGETETTLEIKVSMSYGIPLVRIIRDGRREDRPRDYSSPKRAFNAIGEIVRCAGFEM
jgi:hypothetical protein